MLNDDLSKHIGAFIIFCGNLKTWRNIPEAMELTKERVYNTNKDILRGIAQYIIDRDEENC